MDIWRLEMKYQVFLRNKKQACSFRVSAKDEKEAGIKAAELAKKEYKADFKVWKVFEG
jgi:hypothetical protein